MATERPALPGEACSCGKAATIVFRIVNFGDVPYCGAPHVPAEGAAAPVLTARQVAVRLRLVLERIDQTLDNDGVEDWTADRQLCLEDVESALVALVADIEASPAAVEGAVS